MAVKVQYTGPLISHPDLDFMVRIMSDKFACLEGPTLKVGDRNRVVVPDQLTSDKLKAFAELFSVAAAEQAEMPADRQVETDSGSK